MELEVHRDESIQPGRWAEVNRKWCDLFHRGIEPGQGQMTSIPAIRWESLLAEFRPEEQTVIRQVTAYEGWPTAFWLRHMTVEQSRQVGTR